MNKAYRALIKGIAIPIGVPGERLAVARLRRRGYKIQYFVEIKNDQFRYMVRAKS